MKQHAVTIPNEAERIIAGWGDEGEIDLLEFFGELTLYTSSACLIGRKFREQLDKHVSELFHDLEKGTDPSPTSMPTPTSRASDAAMPRAPNSSSTSRA